MGIIDQTKDVLGIEDSDEKKQEELQQKKAAGDTTHRERLELKELKSKEKDEALEEE